MLTARALVTLAVLAGSSAVGPAHATNLPQRTTLVSAGIDRDGQGGASTRPSVDGSGAFVAFDSTAVNLTPDPNGTVRDVFVRDVRGARTRLVSVAADGGGANGPSNSAVIAARGSIVVWTSTATNLVPGDANGVRDIFGRASVGPTVRVSAPLGGGEADGASREPDLSREGTRIVFTSAATNLVPGDTNDVDDIYVRDFVDGTLRRVSQGANDASSAPSISPDGRYVSFQSKATNLVKHDTNDIADVFVADLDTGKIERVSVSSSEREQNAAVIAPFAQISDVAEDGRYVAFDSDATNLVKGDGNRDTDIFLRDRVRDRTTRVSVDSLGREGDNDSFAPSITPGGRYIAFESFATNLFPRDARKEDVFLHDRALRMTTVVTATSRGRKRGKERVKQLLQRPAISADGKIVAFTSTASLTASDGDRAEDVFLRLLAPPAGRFVSSAIVARRFSYRVRADDHAATVFLCSLDRVRFYCRRRQTFPALRKDRHILRVYAGGPGMLFDPTPARRSFNLRRGR